MVDLLPVDGEAGCGHIVGGEEALELLVARHHWNIDILNKKICTYITADSSWNLLFNFRKIQEYQVRAISIILWNV